jgi:hypothetical protein
MAKRARYGALFAGWAASGAGLVVGFISLGPIALIPAVALILFLSMLDGAGPAAWGLLAGAGALLLFVAYLQRDGPGTHCHSTPSGGYGCGESLDPRPWLAIGLILVAVSIAGAVAARHR